MRNTLRQTIMGRYKNAGIDVQQRVMLLCYFLLVAVVLVSGLIVMNSVLAKDAGVVTITIVLAGIMICALIALVLTVRGWYFAGADITALVAALGVSSLALLQAPRDPTFITNFYYFPMVILLSALFCRLRWTLFVTLVLGAAAAGGYFLSGGVTLAGDFRHFVDESMMDFGFSIVFVFVLSFLIIRVNARVTAQAVAEGEKNRRHYAQLQDAFATLRATSAELAQASETMSRSLATFAEDTQSEAASAEEVLPPSRRCPAGSRPSQAAQVTRTRRWGASSRASRSCQRE